MQRPTRALRTQTEPAIPLSARIYSGTLSLLDAASQAFIGRLVGSDHPETRNNTVEPHQDAKALVVITYDVPLHMLVACGCEVTISQSWSS